MKDTQDKIGYCQLSLGLLYEDSTEYDNNGEVQKLGISKRKAREWANTRKSYWHIANSFFLYLPETCMNTMFTALYRRENSIKL